MPGLWRRGCMWLLIALLGALLFASAGVGAGIMIGARQPSRVWRISFGPASIAMGQIVGDALHRLTGVEIVNQQLAYLMRAGAPDSLDRMVAVTFGRLAIQLIARGQTGRMVALRDGRYTTVPVETPGQGTKRVDVPELYDPEQYRARVAHILDKPMFLY